MTFLQTHRRLFTKGERARLTLPAAVLGCFFLQESGLAQQNGGLAGNSTSGEINAPARAATEAYWTPQRLLRARPISLSPSWDAAPPIAVSIAPSGPSVSSEGAAPTVALSPNDARVLIPEPFLQDGALFQDRAAAEAPGVAPNATSSFGADFTTGRVFPNAAVSTYPNLTTGKLFFHDPRAGGDFVCSASVLRHRIVVTAGHCVSSPSAVAALRYFYTNFMFIPAMISGTGPTGTWTPSAVWVTNTWFFSNGSVPNAQDVGMLVMSDKPSGRIGTVTGYLGYFTNQLGKNNLTMLGYPCNLDSCQRMEINNAQTFINGGNNTFIYGSAMRGGSSGGPWIMDHGVNPVSSPVVALGNNYLVAVTSYGPVSTTPKYQGASNLDSRFISLLNAACGAATTKNCVP